ncbi:MAG: GlxA family transcriptional regulator [Pseudomonadota bacterium]
MDARPKHFVFLLLEDFSQLAFANAVEPLRIANLVSGKGLYRWTLTSETGAPARASNGARTMVDFALSETPACDRLFVLSGVDAKRHTTPGILNALRRERAKGTPLGALCSGAYTLALAGFLDGERAAIHWEFHDAFMEEFPEVALVRSVFVEDAPILSASGGSATADLMLHMIAQDHGEDLAMSVADQMVTVAVREGSASQRVSLQARSGVRSAKLAEATKLMRESVEVPVPTSEIARRVGISPRQLERLFGKYLNTSPKKYMLELRLERARQLLLQTEMSVLDVAVACGFENSGHFSRVYRTAFGVAPSKQRVRLG